jgi:AAA domain
VHPSETRPIIADAEVAAGVVCMMCGVAGSGKTTWARALEARGLVRLSIDEEIWSRFGRYGVPATDGLLDSYLAGFEWPQDEGETVLPASVARGGGPAV